SIQIRLHKDNWKARGANQKLEAALEKHDTLLRQLDEHTPAVLELRSDLVTAEAEHNSLAQCMLESQEIFDISACDLFKCDGLNLDEEDNMEIEPRVQQFKKGSLFSDAKQKVGELKQTRAARLKRLAAKRRRANDDEAEMHGGGGAPPAARRPGAGAAAAKRPASASPAAAERPVPATPAAAAGGKFAGKGAPLQPGADAAAATGSEATSGDPPAAPSSGTARERADRIAD
ncbi:unnamed protein product, partial [Prorocentrum cordatum]